MKNHVTFLLLKKCMPQPTDDPLMMSNLLVEILQFLLLPSTLARTRPEHAEQPAQWRASAAQRLVAMPKLEVSSSVDVIRKHLLKRWGWNIVKWCEIISKMICGRNAIQLGGAYLFWKHCWKKSIVFHFKAFYLFCLWGPANTSSKIKNKFVLLTSPFSKTTHLGDTMWILLQVCIKYHTFVWMFMCIGARPR